MHGCFFKRSPWPHSNVSHASLFIFSSSTSSSRVLLIFAAGTTLSLRDSTRTDFRMDSFVISTLLEISSFLDASTGKYQKTESFARNPIENTEIEKEHKHGMQSKRKHSEVKVSLTKSSRWIIRPMPFFGGGRKEMTGHSGREKVPIEGWHWWDSATSYLPSATEFKVTQLRFTEFFHCLIAD